MIPAGVPTGAPNILLILRGRRSIIERTTPVAMLDFDGHWYVHASDGARKPSGGRPPVALLRGYRMRIDDSSQDYLAEARRHPLFELRPA